MLINQIITLDRTRCYVDKSSKQRCFQLLSQLLSDTIKIEQEHIYHALVARENLGSTAIGHEVALPHARIEKLEAPIAAFISLKRLIEFDASKNVRFLFALLVPEQATETHLQILANLASLFQQEHIHSSLIKASSDRELYEILINHG